MTGAGAQGQVRYFASGPQKQAEALYARLDAVFEDDGFPLSIFEVDEASIIGEQRRIGARGAIDHFGLAVPDHATLEAVRDRLVDAGADVGDLQVLGGDTWSLFFRDVDGMELEVCAPVA